MAIKVTCPKCHADELVLGERDPHCKCGYAATPTAAADDYVEGFLRRARGGTEEWGVVPCPACSQPTLVVQVEEVGCPAFVCFQCAASYEEDDLVQGPGGRWVAA